MATVANGLRAEHSPSYIVEQLLTQAKKQPRNTIIESIRTPGEVAALRTLGGSTFCLLSVDADAKLRYSRVVERKSAQNDRGPPELACGNGYMHRTLDRIALE